MVATGCGADREAGTVSIKSVDSKEVPVACPYCHEKDYDWFGLKAHVELGLCPVYGKVKAK